MESPVTGAGRPDHRLPVLPPPSPRRPAIACWRRRAQNQAGLLPCIQITRAHTPDDPRQRSATSAHVCVSSLSLLFLCLCLCLFSGIATCFRAASTPLAPERTRATGCLPTSSSTGTRPVAVSFFDTNVLVYLASDDTAKADRAEATIAGGCAISVQVLNELANVARRKMKLSWPRYACLAGYAAEPADRSSADDRDPRHKPWTCRTLRLSHLRRDDRRIGPQRRMQYLVVRGHAARDGAGRGSAYRQSVRVMMVKGTVAQCE